MPPPFKSTAFTVPTGFLGDYASIRLEFEDSLGQTCCVDIPLDVAGKLLPLLSERVEAYRRMENYLDPDADKDRARVRHLLASLSVAEWTLTPHDRDYELEVSALYGATARLVFDLEQLHRLRQKIERALSGSGNGPSHSGSGMQH